jgi:chitinase
VSRGFLLLCICFRIVAAAHAQAIVGYYSGDGRGVGAYPLGELTHLIYGFCHLRGGRLCPDSRADSATILVLTGMKSKYPSLKVLLSLGGWGGCRDCSNVFSTEKGRVDFAASVLQLLKSCHADGIDIDWEFPALPAYPGHPWSPSDRENLTRLLVTLKRTIGPEREVSLTAAGFSPYLEASVDWKAVAAAADRIQLMTYDMIGSRNRYSGHHTPLYSTLRQQESTDRSVRFLDSLGVPLKKVVIGVAFYAREFEVSDTAKGHAAGGRPCTDPICVTGLYQPAKFRRFISMRRLRVMLRSGYFNYWDDTAKAAYSYDPVKRSFLTYDDDRSINAKTRYVREKGLGGVMFWQLRLDVPRGGLLDKMYKGLSDQ